MLHSGDRRVGAGRGHPEMRRRLVHAVAVTRPHDRRRPRLEPREQTLVLANRDLGAAVLALSGRYDLAPRQPCDELHAVANAQDGEPEVEDAGIGGRRAVVEYRIRPSRENDALGVERVDEGEIRPLARGMDLAIDARFPDAPRDQLGELRTVIKDQDAIHALYQVVGSAVSPRMRSSSVSRWRAT